MSTSYRNVGWCVHPRRVRHGLLITLLLCVSHGSASAQCEVAKLTAPDATSNQQFGRDVSISGDVALIGTRGAMAYVFRRNDPTWAFEAKLTPSDAPPASWFGESVSVSGNVAVVGAHLDNSTVPQSGLGEAHIMDWHGDCVGGTCVGGLKAGETCWADDDCVDTVQLYHEGIIPDGKYDIFVIDSVCPNEETTYSLPLRITQPRWGDTVNNCTGCPCGPPDGRVDVITDVVSMISKFSNLPCAPLKSRVDLEPGALDFRVNFTDVMRCLAAFGGGSYPFSPEAAPCTPARR